MVAGGIELLLAASKLCIWPKPEPWRIYIRRKQGWHLGSG